MNDLAPFGAAGARQAAEYLRWRKLPPATRVLLFVFPLVFIAEWAVAITFGVPTWERIFDLHTNWWTQPWALVLSVVAHIPSRPIDHLLANMLGFWLVAPHVERRMVSERKVRPKELR